MKLFPSFIAVQGFDVRNEPLETLITKIEEVLAKASEYQIVRAPDDTEDAP